MPGRGRSAGESIRTVSPSRRISPGSAGVDAEKRLRQLAAAGADEAGKADDLAGAHGEADIPGQRLATRSRASSTGAPIGAERLGKEVLDAAADHHLDEFGGVGVRHVARADIGAVAQHRDAVGDRENLVEPMADVDDADAARFEASHDVEQARRRRSRSAPRSVRP